MLTMPAQQAAMRSLQAGWSTLRPAQALISLYLCFKPSEAIAATTNICRTQSYARRWSRRG